MTFSTIITNPFAILSCFGWLAMFAAKKSGKLWLGNSMGLVYHLALAPVVAALPAVDYVRAAGYFWIFCDSLIDVVSINQMTEDNVWALRMGVHIPAAFWIVGSSLQMGLYPRLVGLILGGLLALHAMTGPYLSRSKSKLLVFVLPTMTAWLLLVATSP